MKFWQHLRWKIVIVNLLVAAVAVLTVLMVVTIQTRSALREAANEQALIVTDGTEAAGDFGQLLLQSAEAQSFLRDAFVDSLPLALLIGLLASLATGLLLTYFIMLPYRRWARRSQRISSGRYVDRLDAQSDDELGQVATSFNVMARALAEVQQRRVALVAYLSHELRTPLSGISGYIEGMMDGMFPDTEATLALMYGEVRRMRRLVDDLQMLAHVQSGQVALRMGTFELPPFVKRATAKLQPQWINSGIEVVVEEPKQAMVVFADPDRVDQILLNLLANSLANTPEGGRVSVEILRDGSFARIDIKDTGNGISEEEMPYIFESYYRAKNAAQKLNSGFGIGLTISRHLAWSMGGDLTAESDGEGKGSTFSLSLPISKSHTAIN